ncbi:MAG: type 4a pilus biogenesis protein PilO, partial [Clostridiales bacterium]|nr:type 4a pilus biogenesis protein PilO [Clostridiales bacterium]
DTIMKSYNDDKDNLKKHVLGCRGISTVDKIIIIVASIVIIVSGIFLFTNIRTLKKVNEDITEIRQIIEDKQDTLDRLIELGQSEDALKAEYEKNKLYVPEIKDEVGIISDLTGIVANEGGTFRTITYSTEIEMENGVIDVPFKIRLDSTYEELNSILNEFGRTDRLYVIDSITIIETSDDGLVLNTEIEMHAYYKMK